MISSRRQAMRSPLVAVDTARAFRIILTPSREDTYGIVLEETYGGDNGNGLAAPVVTTTPTQTSRVIDTVVAAVKGSGHAAGVVAFSRRKPIRLDEAPGVRLALVLMATQPIVKHSRVRAIVAGVNSMSVEETYYWYSKCVGVDGPRARKALRILLAND